jgi:hypothetical protein
MWRAAVALALVIPTVSVSHVVDLFRDRTDSRNVAQKWLTNQISSNWTILVPRQLDWDTRPLKAAGLNVLEVDVKPVQAEDATESFPANVGSPSLVFVPDWGADPFVEAGQRKAIALRENSRRWQPIKHFGTQVVEVNHENHAPKGNPGFFVAPFNLPEPWTNWFEEIPKHERDGAPNLVLRRTSE